MPIRTPLNFFWPSTGWAVLIFTRLPLNLSKSSLFPRGRFGPGDETSRLYGPVFSRYTSKRSLDWRLICTQSSRVTPPGLSIKRRSILPPASRWYSRWTNSKPSVSHNDSIKSLACATIFSLFTGDRFLCVRVLTLNFSLLFAFFLWPFNVLSIWWIRLFRNSSNCPP